MPRSLASLSEFRAPDVDTVIDVRAPAEYAEDHVPGALSLPVLTDEERARVGTIYVQTAPFEARKIGAALVARNAARHLEGPLADKPGSWRPLVYCWRGGQRSGSFASILAQVGWRAETVSGGYKAYRKLVVGAMHETALPHRLILLDGNTGTAKTEILARLVARGVQMVDLEGLAQHRGSLLGGMPGGQPSQKAFEGALAHGFDALDPTRPVVVEAESSKIGDLQIPPAVWAAMKSAPRIQIDAPVTARARYLTAAYADLTADGDALHRSLAQLAALQGHERVADWQALARAGAFEALATALIERHYDPRYAKARAGRDGQVLGRLRAEDLEPGSLDRLAADIEALVAGA